MDKKWDKIYTYISTLVHLYKIFFTTALYNMFFYSGGLRKTASGYAMSIIVIPP